jgi:hypothetical protein
MFATEATGGNVPPGPKSVVGGDNVLSPCASQVSWLIYVLDVTAIYSSCLFNQRKPTLLGAQI